MLALELVLNHWPRRVDGCLVNGRIWTAPHHSAGDEPLSLLLFIIRSRSLLRTACILRLYFVSEGIASMSLRIPSPIAYEVSKTLCCLNIGDLTYASLPYTILTARKDFYTTEPPYDCPIEDFPFTAIPACLNDELSLTSLICALSAPADELYKTGYTKQADGSVGYILDTINYIASKAPFSHPTVQIKLVELLTTLRATKAPSDPNRLFFQQSEDGTMVRPNSIYANLL